MDRRGVLSLILVAPAMARQALTEGKWLTVALPGWNRNNRKYAESALVSMAEGIKGKPIVQRTETNMIPDVPDEQGALAAAVGMVTDSRRGAGGSVQVLVRWFSNTGPVEGVLAPWGMGLEYKEVAPGHFEITEYEARCLELTNWSGWEGATAV